jgi:acetyltransferase-like isoleucine patch superfamily enzyme
MTAEAGILYPVVPGGRIPGDWYDGAIPANAEVGDGAVVDSSFTFKRFRSRRRPGLRIGCRVTLWRASLATEPDGLIEIGDDSYIADASLAAAQSIAIGRRVLICGGATIVDSDFHPMSIAGRIADSFALAPGGDPAKRPAMEAKPVVVEDDAWIGWNGIVLPGVRVGEGAVVSPGSVVTRDVPAGAVVAGNPARLTGGERA